MPNGAIAYPASGRLAGESKSLLARVDNTQAVSRALIAVALGLLNQALDIGSADFVRHHHVLDRNASEQIG